MARAKSEAFDVKLTAEEREQLANDLVQDVEDAFNARSETIDTGGTLDLLDWFYEQGQSEAQDRPFPGAADLTSPFITESVDALRARMLRTIFGVEPFCVVDGWGQSASRAPIVEAFHEWQIHEEGLPAELAKVVHGGLLEDCFILEVRERIETVRRTETVDVALELHPESGGPIFSEGPDKTLTPKLKMDGDEPVPAQDGEPSAKVERRYTKTRRLGPEYDVISMRDFVFLPGHAKHHREVFGYAKRFKMRVPLLQERAHDGVFDEEAVKLLGEESDVEMDTTPSAPIVAPQRGPSAEKELYELSIKRDLDGDGREEWYVATVGAKTRCLLRLKLDTFVQKVGKPRCVPFVFFPRRNSVYGYIFAEKLLTMAEEHTALRNMKADRQALCTNAPMTVLSTALWDPELEPFGIGRKITVRDHNEIQQLDIKDVPSSCVEQEQMLFMLKERISGLSDVASVGTQSRQSRTLGQDEMVAQASHVRIEEPIAHLRTAIATVMELRHAIWIDTLEADPKGLEAPAEVVQALQARGVADFDGRFTAQMLKGKFRFKPYGSVETADSGRRMQYFNESLVAIGNLSKMFPGFMQMFQNPDVMRSVAEEWARVYKIRNPSVFLKALMAPPPQMGLPPAGGMDPGGPQPGVGAPPPDLQALMASLMPPGAPRVQ